MIPEQYQNLEIVQRLSDDHNGNELKAMLEDLQTGRSEVKSRLDAGVSTDEYQVLQNAVAAYDAGVEVLPKLWQSVRAA